MIPLLIKPNVDLADSDYPFGKIRDRAGATNGTPVNTEVYGDFHQFFEKLMSVAGIAANELPDNDYNGFQLFQALAKLTIYKTTSDSSFLIATGSKTFSVGENGFEVGNRVRIVSLASSANFMEGIVTASDNISSLTVLVDMVGGSGTLADWVFSIVAFKDTGWINLTIVNNWAAGAGASTPQYRKIGSVVYLRGSVVADGDETNVAFATLPEGFQSSVLLSSPTYYNILLPTFQGIGLIGISGSSIIASSAISGYSVGSSTGEIFLNNISFAVG